MPNPNINQDTVYTCSLNKYQLDYDSESCIIMARKGIVLCRNCFHFEKEDYTIVLRNEGQKHLISPK